MLIIALAGTMSVHLVIVVVLSAMCTPGDYCTPSDHCRYYLYNEYT